MGLVIELAERIGNRLGEGNMTFGWLGNRLVKERQKAEACNKKGG